MAISKSSIIEFVHGICDARDKEVQAELKDFYAKHFDPTFHTVIKTLVDDIPERAEIIVKMLESEGNREGIEALGGISEQSMNNFISSLNTYGVYMFAKIRDNARGSIIYGIEHPYEGAFDYKNDEINKLVARLQKDETIRALVKRKQDLKALCKELVSSANACGSGKQAFNMMVALGVNMDAYKEPLTNLPAIVALTADVCLLNGTC